MPWDDDAIVLRGWAMDDQAWMPLDSLRSLGALDVDAACHERACGSPSGGPPAVFERDHERRS
jgi:hypothetical protein